MRVGNRNFKTIWMEPGNTDTVFIINQNKLPFKLEIRALTKADQMIKAIADMQVRGAGLLGAAAGFAMYVAARAVRPTRSADFLQDYARRLKKTRPTAVNLAWAVDRQLAAISHLRRSAGNRFPDCPSHRLGRRKRLPPYR